MYLKSELRNPFLSSLLVRQKILKKISDKVDCFFSLKIYALIGNKKNDLVKYFMQHIRNGLFIDLINT